MTQDEKPQVSNQTKEIACPLCGGTKFTWGKATGYGGGLLKFRSNEAGIFSRSDEVEARRCNNCGNLQLFSKE